PETLQGVGIDLVTVDDGVQRLVRLARLGCGLSVLGLGRTAKAEEGKCEGELPVFHEGLLLGADPVCSAGLVDSNCARDWCRAPAAAGAAAGLRAYWWGSAKMVSEPPSWV